jgi:hypothetical protein
MKVSVGSEMVRNANENGFRTSKMAASGHLEKNGEKCKRKLISNIQSGLQWRF